MLRIEFYVKILIFTKLKKVFTILSFLLALGCCANAQSKASPAADLPVVQKFYPNPASSFINFEFSKSLDKQCSVQIFNFMGKKVYENIPSVQRITISLDGFYRGVYIFQLRDKSGTIIDSGKFQVIK